MPSPIKDVPSEIWTRLRLMESSLVSHLETCKVRNDQQERQHDQMNKSIEELRSIATKWGAFVAIVFGVIQITAAAAAVWAAMK